MMTSDYSIIANRFAPTTTMANVPSRVMNPIVPSPQQVVVIPRSTTSNALGMPSFSMPTVANFAGGNPLPNQFAIAPTSATTLADGTPLYTDSTVLNALNTGGLPLANNSSLFASSLSPQGANASTLGGLGGNAAPPLVNNLMASPRSISALPTTDNTPSASGDSPSDLLNLLAGLIGPKNDISSLGKAGEKEELNSVSKEEILGSIRDLKATVLAQKDRKDEDMKLSEKTINRTDAELNDKTLVSASPKLSATEKAIG